MYYQNSGCTADLSPAILERTLFHGTNAYHIPNARITAAMCRTNLPSNTAFRGFGGPQALFVMECAIHKAAEALGIPARRIQEINLLNENDVFPYGQRAVRCQARPTWTEADRRYSFETWRNAWRISTERTGSSKKASPACRSASGYRSPRYSSTRPRLSSMSILTEASA